MYQERILLTGDDIYEKEFKVDAMGYRRPEVDKFLDIVMRDYEEFISIIKELTSDIKELSADNTRLKQEVRNFKMKLSALKETADSENGSSSVDILKRISNLEKIIYEKE